MKLTIIFYFCLAIITYSCKSNYNRLEVDTSEIKIEKVQIKRYGKTLFELESSNLQFELISIQPEFQIFLNGDLSDSNNVNRIREFVVDTALISIYKDCKSIITGIDDLESELTKAFTHYRYYYPEKSIPKVYSYISGFDYEHPVQYIDNSLLIALDMYLGADYSKYRALGLPDYMIRKFIRENMVRDCLSEMAMDEINYKKVGTGLLDLMINEGKILWYIEAMDPTATDSVIIKYTSSQVQWALENEGMVWAFLIENELLFSTDLKTYQKLILNSPFTSYFGDESSPRLGMWIGWQIVKGFMERNRDVTISELMHNYDAQLILNNSGYKPDF